MPYVETLQSGFIVPHSVFLVKLTSPSRSRACVVSRVCLGLPWLTRHESRVVDLGQRLSNRMTLRQPRV